MAKPVTTQCEICGKATQLSKALIEGVSMKVCSQCLHHGKAIVEPTGFGPNRVSAGIVTNRLPRSYRMDDDDPNEFILPNAGALIKAQREKMGLRQIDLSKKLNIKESIIHQIESGHAKPTIDIIRKFEAGLNMKLVGHANSESMELQDKPRNTSAGFTLGDFLKKRGK